MPANQPARQLANQPGEIHELFQAAFNARDTEAVLSLYEENAVFVTGPGTSVTGRAGIEEVLKSFFAMKPQMRLETASVLQNNDLAILEGRWVLMGAGPGGDPIQITGTSREVVRRQAGGHWLYVIDDPGTSR